MVKLQLRLDEAQTALILEALNQMIIGGPYDDERDNAGRLESWLTWRRDKLWGPPAGSRDASVEVVFADGRRYTREPPADAG